MAEKKAILVLDASAAALKKAALLPNANAEGLADLAEKLGAVKTDAAGMAAALPGVIAANTTLPVIGVPIASTLEGMDALLSIVQMPPGIPVATVGINGGYNAALLAVEMLALSDEATAARLAEFKKSLAGKIVKANAELAEVKYRFKTN